jgi:tripartite-type tricarboxylate transporter receptor subunit TctC
MGTSMRATVRARTLSVCGVVLGVLPLTAPGQPSNYPTKPIRFLVANAPGGGLDITARTVGPTVSNALGQQLIVDNRGGAAGSLAGEITAKAPPDGHTVLVGSIGPLAVNPHMYKGIGYHPLKDFAPITFAVSGSNILVVHNSVAAKTVPELIALARAERSSLTYGSTGSGNAAHLAAELFSSMAKVKMVHVPYKGGAPAMIALLSGEVQLIFSSAPTAIPQVKAGKVRALAVTTLKRSAVLSDLPTISESGLPGYEMDNWFGIVTTAGTPRTIVERLNAEFVKALSQSDIKEALLRQGLEAAPGTPEAFGAYMKSEYSKWGKIIAEAGIAPN